MKICKTEEEYIEAITSSVQKACKRYGYLPSVLIAQSCLENGYGIRSYWDNPQIEALMTYNNMVGIKTNLLSKTWADKTVWPGESLRKKTPETYNGKNVIIDDDFRKYENIEQSFADFLLFVKYASTSVGGKPKYGDAVLSIKDPKQLIEAVHSRGYATGPTYASNVMKIVDKHKLWKYDDLSNVEPTKYTPGYREKAQPKAKTPIGTWPIKKSPAYNKGVTERGNAQKYIAVHYLGVDGQNNALWNGRYGAHYVVFWDGTIYKVCDHDAVTWQVGTANGTYIQKHPIARNENTIGVEMCCHNTDGYCPETPTGEKHWYFTEATQRAAAWLVRKLMKDLKLDITHVLRHFDVVNKNCPAPYVYNNRYKGTWTWNEFLEAVKTGYCPDGTSADPQPAPLPEPTKSYLQQGDSGSDVKTMQKMLIACGYSCGAAGADGQFGSGTLKAVEQFQKTAGLTVDGLYGSRSMAALEAAYKAVMAAEKTEKQTDAASVFLKAVKAVADKAKKEGWHYGDSHATPPCSDKTISCDRIVARALWDLGYTDQRKGGITCNDMPTYLHEHGFIGTTKKSEIKAGAVVAVGQTLDSIEHVFVVESYNAKTDMCRKYDTGSDARIKHGAYYTNVRLCEWSNRKFLAAWNVPADLKGQTKPKPSHAPAPAPSSTVWNGVDYKPVYNYTYYRKKYPDLRKAFGTDKAAYFKHFCEHGMHECRKASPNFDVKKYRAKYEDLQKTFGNKWPMYYEHYCVHGKFENRKAK